jgi:hypothetical protein
MIGSSRFQNAINPHDIEVVLNLEQGDIVNLGCPAATPQDWARIYSEERDYFAELDTLVIETGSRSFNWTLVTDTAGPNLRFRRYSSFSERLNVPNGNRADFLLGFSSKLFDFRNITRFVIDRAMRGDFSHSTETIVFDDTGQIGKTTGEFPGSVELGAYVPADYRDFNISDFQLNKLVQLLNMTKDDGVQVILVEAPMNTHFKEIIEERYHNEDQRWRTRVTVLTGMEIVELTNYESSCTTWQTCFYDYEHLNAVGAHGYSIALANLLGAS